MVGSSSPSRLKPETDVSMPQRSKTVLVVGASRGLGLALAEEWLERGFQVIATMRDKPEGLEALAARFPDVLDLARVDTAEADTVRALRERFDGRRVGILFINAGIARAIESSPVQAEEKDFLDMMLVNALAPVRTAEILGDLLPASGTIATMTSELGSIANATGSWQLYSSSKAALNMLMKGYAAQHEKDGHTLLLVAPGWVRLRLEAARRRSRSSRAFPWSLT